MNGENISGGYWERVDGKVTLSPNHNKSKLISHSKHHKATVKMTITRVHPIHSGRYRCVIFTPWSVVKSDDVQVTVRSKGKPYIPYIAGIYCKKKYCESHDFALRRNTV